MQSIKLIYTSYYYQIRNFKPYMIPVSTSLGDPKWFHDNKGNHVIFQDKRNVINGIRFEYIMVQKNCCGCPCEKKDPNSCNFLKQYKIELNKLDFKTTLNYLQWLADAMQKYLNLKEEPIIVLMVHESYTNKCSERQVLQDYFNSNGIECKELEYPI